MFRAIVCTLALAVAPVVRAGELDREAAVAATPQAVAAPSGGSELDRESPQASHGWRWGGYYAPGWGWGGYAYGFRAPYFGFAPSFYSYYSFRPFGFYGYGGFGYSSPYFPAYYSPFGYRYWW